nr:sugar ABC transporter permease [Paenibacillus sp. OSY-SE]
MSANVNAMSGRKQIRKRRWTRNDRIGFLFATPMLLGIISFSIYPIAAALFMSFQQTNGIMGHWVGLHNYSIVLSDSVFWRSLYNTMFMGVLSVVSGIVVSFVLASLINSLPWTFGRNFFKSVYFLPNVVSAVATSILFSFLFYPGEEGLLNFLLGQIGLGPVGWFTDPTFSRFSIVLMSMWGALGYNTIIFLAALQSVPRDLYEAAEVDGANGIRKWRYITIPYLRPVFLFMVVMGTIGGMKRFTDVWLIGGTAGNPDGTLLTSVLYIYRTAFIGHQMGLATAASYLLFIVILILTVLILRTNRRHDID